MNMTDGPLLGKIIRFAIPLALSGILQLLFNAADMVVAGRFAGSRALAAVGSTGALTQLIINLFMGLSVGVNVLVARYYGAGQKKDLDETVHTAILTSLISGVFLVFLGILLSRPLLELMLTPADVIDQSILYMRIYFAGMPVMMLYNFGSAVLRAVGDTQRPLYFLTMAGVLNVVMNLFFVIVLQMGVAGVATATVVSQCLSAFLVLRCLVKSDAVYRVDLKRLRIVKSKLMGMIQVGVPAGIQGAMFSISNVLIQSSINSFGSIAMAGNTAAGNIEGFVFVTEDAFTQATLSFTSQNFGAKKIDRVGMALRRCLALTAVCSFTLGGLSYLFARPLLGIYISPGQESAAQVIEYGVVRMLLTTAPHFICAMMNALAGAMRGMGSSLIPTIISVFGVCGSRVLWIYTIFAKHPTWEVLFLCYIFSWTITLVFDVAAYVLIKRRITTKEMAAEAAV